MLIVGEYLARQSANLRVGPMANARALSFPGVFSLVACDVGLDCTPVPPRADDGVRLRRLLQASNFEELYQNFLASPWRNPAIRYRALIHTAIQIATGADRHHAEALNRRRRAELASRLRCHSHVLDHAATSASVL